MDGKGFDDLTRKVAQGMSRRTMLRGLIGGGAAVVAARTGATLAAPAAKQDICHVEGNGSFHLINVSVNALPAHEAHGDGYLGTNAHCSACGDACSEIDACTPARCDGSSCNTVSNCDTDQVCDSGQCIYPTTAPPNGCGGSFETCCAGNYCNLGLSCQNGQCNVDPCYPFGTCPNGTCYSLFSCCCGGSWPFCDRCD